MRKPMHTIMFKPTCECNLNCKYCYDRPMRERYKHTRASKEILEHTVKLLSNYADTVQWYWHGGEPTLMGHDYYYDAQDVFSKNYTTTFIQALQSNGINPLKDRRWIKTCKDCGIGMGFSFDLYGQTVRLGKDVNIISNFEEMLEDFKDSGARSCIESVTVITNKTIDKLIDTYEHFKSRFGGDYIFSMLLIFEIDENNVSGLGISQEDYIKYYPKYLNHVLHDISNNALVDRYINTYINVLLGYPETSMCGFIECRRKWLSVNPDGTVTHCDREPGSYYNLGNILDYSSIEEIYESDMYKQFEADCEERLNNYCKKCDFYQYCNGGCHSNHGSVNNTRVNKVNPRECYTLQQNLMSVYNMLQTIHKYLEYNAKLKNLLNSRKAVLPWEIYEFLKAKGIDYSYEIDIDSFRDKPSEFINSIQFNLFKIFNSEKDISPKTERLNKIYNDNFEYIQNLKEG